MAELNDRKEFEGRADFIDNQDLLDWTVENEQFQHLGSINAIEFGLSTHKELLGKPVRLDFKTLQIMFLICNNTVKLLNNFLFLKVLNRTVEKEYKDYHNWSWDFGKDKDKFKKYFDVFAADESQASIKDAYEDFKNAHAGTVGK